MFFGVLRFETMYKFRDIALSFEFYLYFIYLLFPLPSYKDPRSSERGDIHAPFAVRR
jgi:hypothetical protein